MIRRSMAVAALAVVLLVGACSDDAGDDVDPVAAAQEDLDQAEEALAEAMSAFDEASAQLCEDSADYIESVDRYGGLLTDDEATVGAVTDAGSDLEEPRKAVDDSVDAVGTARDDLAAAQEDVVAAQVALAEAQTGTSAAEEITTTTLPPLVPADAIARVEQAEQDLADAFDGIDESTPLSEATAQVNAAAVSVQVAWTQLFASAGCLADDGQLVTAVGDYTRALQAALAAAGYLEGEPDGVYGPATVAAVEQLQSDAGLPVTGLVDRATAEALDAAVAAAGGDAATVEVAHTAALQSVLTIAGYWTGPIDGEWSDALIAALKEFQTDLGVEPTGVVDPATIAAAQKALGDLQSPTTTTEAESEGGEETTSTTAS